MIGESGDGDDRSMYSAVCRLPDSHDGQPPILKCLERIESELNATVVASNPAMFWYVLSKLGIKYPMTGYGRLLREWPALRD